MSFVKHGMDGTPIYRCWISMRSRCNNPNDKDFKHYGGRGIKVCERWQHSFENFYADMGPRPSDKHSIDRIDVNGNYGPSNCRWATKRTQRINRRVGGTTNILGVNLERGKYRVRIRANGKYLHIGNFNNVEDAAKARRQAERDYWNDNNT